MNRDLQGTYVTISTVGEKATAFVPAPLPPYPSIDWTPELRGKFDQALLALGRLDSVSTLLPDTSLFLYMYVRKEAVLSSMIEGTQSSLSDLLLFELEQEPGVPLDDVREVSNYVAALHPEAQPAVQLHPLYRDHQLGYGAAGWVGLRFSLTPHLRDPAPAAVRWEPDGAQLRQRATI